MVAICCFFIPKLQYSQRSWFGLCIFLILRHLAALETCGLDSAYYLLVSGLDSVHYLQDLGPWLGFCTLFATLGACDLYSV